MTYPAGLSRGTRTSLFVRIRDGETRAWHEFEDRYRELMVRFCKRHGLQQFDAEDVVQRVTSELVKTLPKFAYDRKRGRFRDYLYRCVRGGLSHWARQSNRQVDQLRSAAVRNLEANSGNGWPHSNDETIWEEEWVAHHYRLAMNTLRQSFEPRSVLIFDRSIAGATIAQLAAEFTMSEEAVRKVRERIRNRLAELIAEQVREEDEPHD